MVHTDAPDDLIANALAALGSPVRLRLLRAIREPRALREIEVQPGREGGERNLSRQTVREHLDRLIDVGMVSARDAERAYGRTQEFMVNHQAIYALGEEVRSLARAKSVVEQAMPTMPLDRATPPKPEGPALVVVKGLDEGTAFALDSPPGERRSNIIGRRRGVHVSLDFDPFISSENALVEWDGQIHTLRDIAESTNGTSLNFRPLPRGGSAILQHGDVIGVGRTLLLYWRERRLSPF